MECSHFSEYNLEMISQLTLAPVFLNVFTYKSVYVYNESNQQFNLCKYGLISQQSNAYSHVALIPSFVFIYKH